MKTEVDGHGPQQRTVRRSLAGIGGFVPTIFDIPEIWRLNAPRAGGKFNLIFGWWITPLFVLVVAPLTVICLIEWAFMSEQQKDDHRKKWGA